MTVAFSNITNKLLDFSKRNRVLHSPNRKKFIEFRDTSKFLDEVKVVNENPYFEFRIKEKDLLNYEKIKDLIKEYKELKKSELEELFQDEKSESGMLKEKIYQGEPNLKEYIVANDESLETVSLEDYFGAFLRPWGKSLIASLNSHRLQTKRINDEHGQYTLFLAFGALKWTDPEKNREYHTPLHFFPVEISVSKNPKEFIIKNYEEESYQGNQILGLFLEKNLGAPSDLIPELNLNLSFFESVEIFFQDLDKKIKEHLPTLEYEIIRSIKFDNFQINSLYWEADKYKDKYQENQLIKALTGQAYTKDAIPTLPDPSGLDTLDIAFAEGDSNNCILEADSSQLEVIYKAQQGGDLVVTGPPGTGKSQTIVNLISDYTARGKKVLFVCAKKVALEVVYDRLKLDEQNNLQKLTIPLFDTKLDKKEFYSSLYEDFQERVESVPTEDKSVLFSREYSQKRSTQEELNTYTKTLLGLTGSMKISPWEAYGRWSSAYFLANGVKFPLKKSVYDSVSQEEFHRYEKLVEKFSTYASLFEKEGKSLYSFFEFGEYTPTKIGQINDAQSSLNKKMSLLFSTLDKLGLKRVADFLTIKNLEKLADVSTFISGMKEEDINSTLVEAKNRFTHLVRSYELNNKESEIEYKTNVTSKEIKIISPQLKSLDRFKKIDFDLFFKEANPEASLQTFFSEVNTKSFEGLKHALTAINNNSILNDISILEVIKYSSDVDFFSLFEYWDDTRFSSDNFKREFVSLGIELNKLNTYSVKLEKKGINLSELSDNDIKGISFNFNNNYTGVLSRLSKDYKRDLSMLTDYFYGNVKLSFPDAKELVSNLKGFVDQSEAIKNLELFKSGVIKQENIVSNDQWSDVLEGMEKLKEEAYPIWLNRVLKEDLKGVVRTFKEINKSISPEEVQILFNSLFKNDIHHRISNADVLIEYLEFLNEVHVIHNKTSKYLNKGDIWMIKSISDRLFEVDILNDFQEQYEVILQDFNKDFFTPSFFSFVELEYDNICEIITSGEALLKAMSQKELSVLMQEKNKLAISEIKSNAKNIFSALDALGDKRDGTQKLEDLNVSDLSNIVIDGSETQEEIRAWMDYRMSMNSLEQAELNDFAVYVISNQATEDQILSLFRAAFWTKWIEECGQEKPVLWETGVDLSKKVSRFSEHDVKLQKLKCQEILEKYSSLREPENTIETRILREQASKKRSHLPLRKFIPSAVNTMMQLKKCWLMSPHALVKYLPIDNQTEPLFDVVIFDEASQMTTQEAMAGIVRAKQVIVVGDSMQLPPTRFFIKGLNNEEEDEDQFSSEDFESILDMLKAIIPETQKPMLKWHYRCQYESLIAASNKYFYNNRLITFPSNTDSKKGIEFNYRKDLYDRGASATNKGEATRIAEECISLCKNLLEVGKEKTLGVICLNIKQEDMVRDILEIKLKDENVVVQTFFDENSDKKEAFFIKNLESVQGDERDVIFLSVGYGYDESGVMKNNFGPLNKKGGNRRLNVAISRAKERMVIFSSIRGDDIKGDNLGEGGGTLRNFLRYAERCPEVGVQQALFVEETEVNAVNKYNDTDSPFEDSVIEEIQALGYEVHKQIGVSGFKIDLAIVDPRDRSQYLLGIECDGATYHGTRCARERDRLRQEILERRGWEIFRIWSTDWFSDPRSIIDVLDKKVKRLLK